ncbi:sodium/proton antiporter, CPA1 family [Lentzea xinjiangensis]|uniref:Sodium/proton antiporter, CPA1 family n=1 Tax=Lentzea xinjiangensis TaxID=402600 RepID=A0A1H9V5J7_9PSEU|nr:Na+/H+ antiporter [Lentzea xinjiangensis]SES16858.1 sodium/proton antiporter, CPA1 family [Lentzea xinjiangensis]
MLGLELVVVLGVCVLAASVASGRLRVAAPVLLVVFGAVLGFVPALESVSLPPEAMLLIFLPALLYWESLTTSLREIRSNLRPIVLLSTLLVLATAAAVAAVAHALGLGWGPAWVLGAALAPTDATAVSAIARGLPRRTGTILRAESLINDGTALVIYAIAVSITIGEQEFSTGVVGLRLLLSYAGGAVAGLVVAWLAVQVRKRLDNPVHETVVSILTPFAAFLLAETVHGSGVIAVVTCGLTLAQVGPRIVPADTRQVSYAFWGIATFVLNGALFVLIGLQAHSAVRSLDGSEVLAAFGAIGLVALTVTGTRLLWSYTTPYVIRALDRRPQQRLRRMGARQRLVSSVAGFRGAVSLAAALAVPQAVTGGGPFPFRDEIVLITSGVVVLTLVVQSAVLPAVIRFSRLPEDTALDEELRLAQTTASEEAYEALPALAGKVGVSDVVYKRVRAEYEHHLEVVRAKEAGDEEVARSEVEYTALRLELIAHKRATVVRLRDEQAIDDIVLRTVQRKLDIEEVRLSRREPEED